MPNRAQALLLFLIAVVLTFSAFFLRTKPVPSALQAQLPIDPETLTGNFDPSQTESQFHGQEIAVAPEETDPVSPPVLGSTNELKRIFVDLGQQRLQAYEGDRKVYDFLISSGKWGRTPTGSFTIWGKFRYTKMEGGSKALHTYYYLPNVPYVMFFSNSEVAASRGFSLHGTYWHSNFGHPMSHGCINMKTEEAELIYYWANPDIGSKKSGRATTDNPGTEVIIYGEAPKD